MRLNRGTMTDEWMKRLSEELVERNEDRGRTYDNSPNQEETLEIIERHYRAALETDWLTIATMICLHCDIEHDGKQVLPGELAKYMRDIAAQGKSSPVPAPQPEKEAK